MPNAAATFDDAFDYDEPARRKAPRRPRASGKGPQRKKGRRFAFDTRKIARWAAVGLGTTVALTIMVNALVLQKSRHPAPLFGKAIALGPGPAPVDRAPAPPAEAPVAAPEAVPAPVAKPRASADISEDEAPRHDDAIGRLLQGGGPAPASAKPDTKTVMSAQRALAKLGFALKPNGTLGPQTRKAIEAFEKDRHLPVKGELTRRLVKILAAESGIRID